MKGVSLIVCCYNSAERLSKTLNYIALQKVNPAIQWEVIMVDNASTDETAKVALNEWSAYGLSTPAFKVVEQPVPGLSQARKKGAQSAAFDYLVLCDDDNWLCDTYVDTVYKLFEQWPNTAVIGGLGTPVLEDKEPFWFQKYHGCFAVGKQGETDGKLEGEAPYVFGAGAAIRRSLFQEIENKALPILATDRISGKLSSGGDVELCYIAKLLGYDISYSSQLQFFHVIDKNKLNQDYLAALMYGFGYCDILHRPYHWLFKPEWPVYKKNWLWTLLISAHIYFLSALRMIGEREEENVFASKMNYQHAKGRLMAIFKLNNKIDRQYAAMAEKFKKR